MAGFLEQHFEKVANEYSGEYYFTEENIVGIGRSSLPLTKHYININSKYNKISFYIEMGETALATVRTKIQNANKSRIFKIIKRSHYLLLFSKNKQSLVVQSKSEDINKSIESMLLKTGLEEIANESLFDPIIKFKESGNNLEVELLFSMAFKNKEKVIKPIIEFLNKVNSYIQQ